MNNDLNQYIANVLRGGAINPMNTQKAKEKEPADQSSTNLATERFIHVSKYSLRLDEIA